MSPYDPDYDRPAGDRRPPQDLDAERALLAVLVQNPDLGDQLRTEVYASDFYRPTHEKIWATWHDLHQAGGVPPDVVTLNSALIRDRETEAVRELADLATATPSPLHAAQYAAIVRDHARLRIVDHVATSLRDVVNRGSVEHVAKYLEEAVERIDDAYGRFGARTGHVTPTTWTPVDLTAVLAGEMLDPPPTMLQRTDGVSLFYDGAVHTVAGESESGKTWFCLLAALQLLQAGDDITFLDFEDRADRVIGRLLALGATPTQIQQHFAYVRPDRPLDDDGRAQLAPAITGRRLVIVDGVTEAMTMHGFDLNSNADSALFQGLIPRWIADHGPAVVMIDHVVKDKEKQDRFALGAQHKLAGIDGVAYIVKMLQPFARGHRGVARVEVAKDRPGHVREHARGRTIAEFTLDASVSDVTLTADLVPPATRPAAATTRRGNRP
ncbi:DnaB-like helicase N-terminal domain-containing protein [Nocardioides zeae]